MPSPAEAACAASPPNWRLCRGCGALVYGRRLARNLLVCPECDHHHPMTARERIDVLLDDGSTEFLEVDLADGDPLGFTDRIDYPQRRAQARARTGMAEAVLCATGTVEGTPAVLAVMDFRFLGGSLSSAVGELITRAGELALARHVPFVMVSASGGARMQEGVLSLMQMVKTSQLLGRLDAAGVLTVSVITDPTFGGVAASYATLADVIIAEPRARLGFAGPRVIEQTIRKPLPEGFQTAEFLMSHGLVDMLCPRAELRTRLASVLRLARGGLPSPASVRDADPVIRESGELAEVDAWTAVQTARNIRRPTAADYIGRICTEFVELQGDRLTGDCLAILGGLGMLADRPVVLIGVQKGHTAAELMARNFGMASPAGYRKSARLMRLAAKLGIPVVTLVDTPGASPGLEAEEHGQAFAIAENIRLMAGLPIPVVAVVIGEGGSGGALALAVADRVLMFDSAVYSVISPEGCAAILWSDATAAPVAARALRVDARHLLELGVVDGVIGEPDGGTQADHDLAARRLRAALTSALAELNQCTGQQLRERRQDRFRRFGAT